MKPELTLDSLYEGREGRDEGMARVLGNNPAWTAMAREAVRSLPSGWQGTAEDMRLRLIREGLPQAPDPHCWGGITNWAKKNGMLLALGRRRQMRSPRSHARSTDVYERTFTR